MPDSLYILQKLNFLQNKHTNPGGSGEHRQTPQKYWIDASFLIFDSERMANILVWIISGKIAITLFGPLFPYEMESRKCSPSKADKILRKLLTMVMHVYTSKFSMRGIVCWIVSIAIHTMLSVTLLPRQPRHTHLTKMETNKHWSKSTSKTSTESTTFDFVFFDRKRNFLLSNTASLGHQKRSPKHFICEY